MRAELVIDALKAIFNMELENRFTATNSAIYVELDDDVVEITIDGKN